jgi:superfamily II DNA or RNA helicase
MTIEAELSRASVALDKAAPFPKGFLDKVRKDLRVRPNVQPGFPVPRAFPVYHETPRRLCVPRHFPLDASVVRVEPRWPAAAFERLPAMAFEGTLNDGTRQNEAARACLAAMEAQGGGVLSLPTGYGKTTVALYVACRLGLRTLVLTHKEFLMEQWIERIQRFVPAARIGRIRQDAVDVQDKDIVVGMMQSVCMRTYEPGTFAQFGLLVLDEVHHVSAPVFCRCLFSACCPYVLGLSATPERKDGLTRVLEWFVGPVFFRVERKEQRHVEVRVVHHEAEWYGLPLPTTRAGTLNLPEAVNRLCADAERNSMIARTVRSFLSESRKVMILSDRRVHCEVLCGLLAPHAALYIGGMRREALKAAEESRVIVATYGQANEGLDIPSLDTLVLATPRSDVVQSAGRILREASGATSGAAPVILDVVDRCGVFFAQFAKRKKYYAASGFGLRFPAAIDEPEEDTAATTCAFADDD